MTFTEAVKKTAQAVRTSVSHLLYGSTRDVEGSRRNDNAELDVAPVNEDESSEGRLPTRKEKEGLRKRAHQAMDKYPTAFKRLAK